MNAKGVQKVSMPNLVGYSARQAVAELNSRGLVLGKFIYVSDMATNNVLKQKYRGRDVEPGDMVEAEARIDLVVGLNPANSETLIPNVIGKRAVEASRDLNDYYINVRALRYDKSVKTAEDSLKAVVYKQAPEASELPVKMGTEVTLYLRVEEVEAQ
jgi:beta-lactam-binding protein with PASTA domain